MIRLALRLASVCLLFALLVRLAAPARAASFAVNTLADSNNGSCGAPCSLRDAITAANLAGGTNTITFSVSGSITLGSALPQITNNLTIIGNGAANTIIDGAGSYQVFNIGNGVTASLSDLTIQNGSAPTGGGVANVGILAVTNSTVSNNSATDSGGGIYNGGTLTLTNSTISSNSAYNSSGGILNERGAVTITNSTLSNNTTTRYSGGGIYNFQGTLTITGSTVSNNVAGGGTGGIVNDFATLTITSSIVSGNSGFSGGIDNALGTVTITSSTLSGNTGTSGGGILNDGDTITLINSTLSGNTGDDGGGIYNYDHGKMTLINTTLSGNFANSKGGGIYDDDTSEIMLINSTLSENSTSGDGGSTWRSGTVIASNSIFYNNVGNQDCFGGILEFAPNLGCGGAVTGDPMLGAFNGTYYPLLSGSPAIDAGDNSRIPSGITTDQIGNPRIQGGTVDLGAYEFPQAVAAASSVTGAPVSDLCQDVTDLSDSAITVSGGVQNVTLGGVVGNTYCRLIALDGSYVTSAAEIGVPSVLDLGVVDAVDVFGQLPAGETVVPFVAPVTVCLRGSGDVLFLSAAGVGRSPQHLASTVSGEYTCVSVPNSGTVVLVGQASNLPVSQAADTSSAASTTLANCRVTTLNAPLNLRSDPNTSASVIAQLPYNLTLTATEYSAGWYRVIYLDGQGWVSAQYVSPAGDCNS